MSEKVTDADRESAAAYLRVCASHGNLAVAMAARQDLLLQAFAAHRIAAIKAERERCVEWLRNHADRAYVDRLADELANEGK